MSAGTAYYLTADRAVPGRVSVIVQPGPVIAVKRDGSPLWDMHLRPDEAEDIGIQLIRAARQARLDALADAMAEAER